MRKSSLFWGGVIIVIGIVALVGNTLDVNVWNLIWPALLVLLGVWVILGVRLGRQTDVEAENAVITLDGAEEARVRISHGAGRLRIGPGAGPDEVASGTFGGGVDVRKTQTGQSLDLKLRMPPRGFPGIVVFPWGQGGALDWSVKLTDRIPLSLRVSTGASDTRMDLTDLKVTELRMETGASSNRVALPAHAGYTNVDIDAGAASLDVLVPDGVAARIRISSGLSGISVDRGRFPRTSGKRYQSPDYDTAANKVDIRVDVGVGSVRIR
jgi:hypothetical protein